METDERSIIRSEKSTCYYTGQGCSEEKSIEKKVKKIFHNEKINLLLKLRYSPIQKSDIPYKGMSDFSFTAIPIALNLLHQ